ncbi:MAG: sigma-E processing peptidase SpoIIGA [Lachnospiraceae bacterium]|nr:sigma-E processing peptidase SpoIIGA [Lachnospiraceae bacterium]
MKYELYIDAFFLLNFVIDTLLLFLVGKVLGCTATHLRLLFGGAFGAGMACVLTVVPFLPIWGKLFAGYGIISICMLRITFSGLRLQALFRAGIVLYGFAFLLGGLLQMLSLQISFFRRHGMTLAAVCAVSICAAGAVASLYEKWKRSREDHFVPVRLVWQGRELTVRALVDTGNSLREPISGKPVSIVEKRIAEQLFGGVYPTVFRAVPFRSIGKGHGILEGYEITELTVTGENEKIKIKKPVVGLFDGRLSTDAAYQMILHPELLQKGDAG